MNPRLKEIATAAFATLLTVGATAVSAEAPPTKAPIVIGVTVDLEGYAAPLGLPWTKAADVWAKWINGTGGILGHPVVLLTKDTRSDPATGARTLEAMIHDPKVVAIDEGGDDTPDSMFATVAKAKVPLISGVYDDTLATHNPNVFPVGAAKDMVRMAIVVRVGLGSSRRHTNGAFLYIPDERSVGTSLSRAAARAGSRVVYRAQIAESPPADYDYTSVCRAAKARKVGWMFLMLFPKPIVSLAHACANLGYKPTWVAGYYISNFSNEPALDGMRIILSNALYNGQAAGILELRRAVAQYDPQQLTQPYFGESSVVSWGSLQLIAKAIEAAHPEGAEVTRADVYRGLYRLKDETLGGISPPLTFRPGRPTMLRCYFIAKMKDGKLVASSSNPICLKAD